MAIISLNTEKPVTVLVVDDDAIVRKLTSIQLGNHGYQVILACAGEEALEMMNRQTVDIILLDVMMPGIDGFEVCRRLKNDLATALIPILLVTALTDKKSRRVGLEAGADDFISKPVSRVDLLSTIGRHLQMNKNRRSDCQSDHRINNPIYTRGKNDR